jgi:hypothetical protein
LISDADRELADTFDDGSDDENDGLDDRQRLMRGSPTESMNLGESQQSGGDGHDNQGDNPRQAIERRVTQLPVFSTPSAAESGRRVYGGNDGVFANLSAKPQAGEDLDEKPPVSPPCAH